MHNYAPAPQYLSAAADAKLVHQVSGSKMVAALLEAETSFCYVEYCENDLLNNGATQLIDYVRQEFPAASFIRLRADAVMALESGWECERSDLEYTAQPPDEFPEMVRRSESKADEELVREWLFQAFKNGASERARNVAEAQLRADADEIFRHPDRESLVCIVHDRPVGHATLLHNQHDHVTDAPYIDLVDILIEPPFTKEAMPALSAAAAHRASELGAHLVGNVVHPAFDHTHGLTIVQRLESRGWVSRYRTWKWTLQ